MNEDNLSSNSATTEKEIAYSGGNQVVVKKDSNILLFLGLLIVLFLALAGVVYLKQQNSLLIRENALLSAKIMLDEEKIELLTDSSQSSNTNSEDWITYNIPDEKLSFNYPSSWKIEMNTYMYAESEWSMGDIKITSPSNFLLRIRTNIDGLGGGCTEECQEFNIPNQTLGVLNFYTEPLYIVLNGLKPSEENNTSGIIRFNVIPKEKCWVNVCYGFEGVNTKGTTIITGEFVSKDDATQNIDMSAETFVNSEDVKTAIQILESFSYLN